MNPTGISFYSTLVDVTGKLQILYSFQDSGYDFIPSVPHGNTAYSGFINNTGNFWQVNRSGSGFFNSDTLIKISNASGLNSQTSWTTIINYEQSSGQNSVLFSSYQSGESINSGFLIGINSNGSPYFEYYTPNGPTIGLSDKNYGSKNSLWITKTYNNLSFEYLNFNTKELESENWSVDDNYWINSDNWYLGGQSGAPAYWSGSNFIGYMDCFVHYSPALLANEKNIVKSGLYTNIFDSTIYITTGYTSGITGFNYTVTPIFTGVTGFTNTVSGYITGTCDNVQTIYSSGNLTGIIYDSGVVPVYDFVVNYYTGISGANQIENSGYSMSFGMEAVSYLKNINATDLSELFYYPISVNKININQELIFDRTLGKFILPTAYNTDQLNFYVNSAAQFGSGYSVTGGFYNRGIQISGMYFNSGIYLSGNYNGSDTNIIDIVSGARAFSTGDYYILPDETGISGLIPNKCMVFAEGVKLPSGLWYKATGINFQLTNPYIYNNITSQRLWSMPIDLESSYVSGIWNVTGVSKFARNTSQVYINGLRANINDEYLEISRFSLLNNSGRYLENLNSIYNNENNWTEYL